MNAENAVELRNVEMHFNMSKEKLESLKEYFLKLVTRKLMFEDFIAVDNVSFDIKKGDVFGIVGLNGSVLGYSKKFMDEKFDDIVEFSEMREFLDTPMKNYSSGMVARIGFAIATVTKPDILIVDEILAVGDFHFQEKCEQRINSMINDDTTVIIVSHSIEQIERLCKHCVWLEKGKIRMIGDAKEVCDAYKNS